jgi:hypothetical protein
VDTTKVSPGETIAGVSALALFIFMFLPWYGVDSVGGFEVGGGSVSAWEAFSFIDILLLLAIAVVLGLVLARAADAMPDLPQPPGLMIAAAGGLALLLVLFRLIFTPGVDTGGFDVDVDLGRKIGIFLGLIAAAGMAYGGWRASNETPAIAGAGRDRPAPPAAPAASTPPPAASTPPPAATPPAAPAEPASTPTPPPAPPADPPPAADPPSPGGQPPQQ